MQDNFDPLLADSTKSASGSVAVVVGEENKRRLLNKADNRDLIRRKVVILRSPTSLPLSKTVHECLLVDSQTFLHILWGIGWRSLIVPLAIISGLLLGWATLVMVFLISIYFMKVSPLDPLSLEQGDLISQATANLTGFYPQHTLFTTVLLWFPLVLAVLVGAIVFLTGYRRARRSWPYFGRLFQPWSIRQARSLLHEYGLDLDPKTQIKALSLGKRKQLEIVKTVQNGIRTVVLIEPMSGLSDQERADLLRHLKFLAELGISIIVAIDQPADDVMACAKQISLPTH